MTDTLPRRAAHRGRTYRVRRSRDRRAIDALLSEDRAYAAYALGYLEAGLFERSEFWLAEGTEGSGMVLLTDALGAAMVTFGDPSAVDAILSLHPGARTSYLSTATPAHVAAIERWHRLEEPLTMQRMSLTREQFRPQPGDTERLRGSDTHEINALYALDDRPSHYTPLQIERSIYYGAYEDGDLVSIAGTHLVSPLNGIGMVGNVLTHPRYRGRGLAKRVTSAVTADLLDRGCTLAVLTAAAENMPAIRAYDSLGYQPGAVVIEAHLRRRDVTGIGSWLRRRGARTDDEATELASSKLEAETSDHEFD